ncbi:MAG: hypothetical protein A2X82_06960 [Geobacteraceae bacterium GWC2_55_20]|nr:MAG: hypothetical protein A2X82_06960 [Geobacteraceae bacterium GWC2_55_20]HCE68370.1 hypothetical protein [Geobacter sp.]
MKPTHSTYKINLDNSTKDAVKQLQARHPLPTISSVVAQMAQDAVHPVSGAARAREFLRQAGRDFAIASELLLRYLHSKYKNFNCKRQPGKREYDRIRKSLHNISRMN